MSVIETRPVIRWDIVEEHLDEAAFLYGQWEEALRSPLYTLPEIAGGPEERMLAHLDGLVLGGPDVVKKLLLPALAADEPGLIFAAAFALVQDGRAEDFQAVLTALEKGESPQRAAIRRALAVVPHPDLGQRLAALVPKALSIQADLLEVLAYLQVDPGIRLEPLLAKNEPLAIRIARAFPARLDPVAIDRGLTSPLAEVKSEALETKMVLGHAGAPEACAAEVRTRGPAFRTAALLLAISGEESAVAALGPALAEKKCQTIAAVGLGFTGRVSAAEALLAAMDDAELAPVAAEAFSAITGLVIAKQFANPPERSAPDEQDTDEEAPAYGPEADLPKPIPAVIAHWWQESKPRFSPTKRWLRGQPWTQESLLGELEGGPARRRAALALELAVRTRGRVQIAWDALTLRQRKQMEEAREAAGRVGVRR